MWWVRELLASLRFLAISGNQPFLKSKRVYEFVLPAVVTVVLFVLFSEFPRAFAADFLEKITANIFQFMVFVVPFHLAALGAFATFERQGLDEKLAGTNAQIRVWSNKESQHFYETLSLRQYASLLFGYLCTIGVIYIIVYIVLDNVDFDYIAGKNLRYLERGALVCIMFFVSHYAFLSVYSITFLFEKINKIGEQN
ncbi:MAG: hypothetical protein EOR99_31140 [Mesorhizobium sp.]|nr:MAG: hypothetical protein EOR99_31140 [Mesorhizobium sp.]